MNDNQNNNEAVDDNAICRLRWVTEAMEAARRHTEARANEVHSPDACLTDVDQS